MKKLNKQRRNLYLTDKTNTKMEETSNWLRVSKSELIEKMFANLSKQEIREILRKGNK